MSEPWNEELLSAFLDGELEADEQQRVERWIAEDDGARQMLEELQLLRDTLQSLPRRNLDIGFADRVLEQAKLRSQTVHRPSVSGPANEKRMTVSRFNWRRVVWASTAVAAALLILALSPNNEQEGAFELAERPVEHPRDLRRLNEPASVEPLERTIAEGSEEVAEIFEKGGTSRPPTDGEDIETSEELFASRERVLTDNNDADARFGFNSLSPTDRYRGYSNNLRKRAVAFGDDEERFIQAAAKATGSDLVVRWYYARGTSDVGEFESILRDNSIPVADPDLELVNEVTSAYPTQSAVEQYENQESDSLDDERASASQTRAAVQLVLVDASARQIYETASDLERTGKDESRLRVQAPSQSRDLHVDDNLLTELNSIVQAKGQASAELVQSDFDASSTPTFSDVSDDQLQSYAQRIEVAENLESEPPELELRLQIQPRRSSALAYGAAVAPGTDEDAERGMAQIQSSPSISEQPPSAPSDSLVIASDDVISDESSDPSAIQPDAEAVPQTPSEVDVQGRLVIQSQSDSGGGVHRRSGLNQANATRPGNLKVLFVLSDLGDDGTGGPASLEGFEHEDSADRPNSTPSSKSDP